MNQPTPLPPSSLCLTFHASKGGVGTSVVSAATAILSSEATGTLLVDLTGDHHFIFGSSVPAATLSDWLRSDNPHPDSLSRLEVTVAPRLSLLGVEGGGCLPPPDRLRALAQMLRNESRNVIVDLGRMAQAGIPLIQNADRSYLVTRPCYLALRAAMVGPRPDGIVLVSERGRPLQPADVASAIGAPVTVELAIDPIVFRAVDSGLLAKRFPRSLRPLETLL